MTLAGYVHAPPRDRLQIGILLNHVERPGAGGDRARIEFRNVETKPAEGAGLRYPVTMRGQQPSDEV